MQLRALCTRTAVMAAGVVLAACVANTDGVPSSPAEDPAARGDASAGASATSSRESIGPAATPEASASAGSRSGTAAPETTGAPEWQLLADGLDEPAAMLVDPRTGEDLVVQLGGQVVRLDGTPVLDLSDRVLRTGERGLLDATTTPSGDAVIVHYSGDPEGRTVLSRLPILPGDGADGRLADPGDEQVLLEFEQPAGNHNGGSAVFGSDGLLHLALGDGGQANDAFGNGADPTTPLGAILRLDVTSRPGEVVVPDDNPFVDGGGDARVWAHGVRNPWRIATDGDSWFVADVGQDAVEEVTVVPATTGPHDLGWPDWEGDFCRVDTCDAQPLPPVATLTHTDGACSIIGMAVARQPAIDAGAAFWTDFCDPRVWRLEAGGAVVEDQALPDAVPAYALDVDADGSVVALTTDGRLWRRTRR